MKVVSGIGAIAALAGLALTLSAPPALAAHGKAGLWNVTISMVGAGVPKLSKAARAQMEAHGITVPNDHTMTAQHCMTQKEVEADKLSLGGAAKQGCSVINRNNSGKTMSADMICNGAMKGHGHIAITYDTPEHYTGKMTFTGSANGRTADMTYLYKAQWQTSDCGGVNH